MKRLLTLLLTIISSVNVWGTEAPECQEYVAVRPLSCIQNLQLSIGPEGFTVITPQMILTDTFADYSPFEVLVDGENSDTITCAVLNTSVMVTIRDTRNGNSCWSNISVEDKLPPEIECFNDTLPCYIDPFSVNYDVYATATDNCDPDVELWYAYLLNDLGCMSDEFVSYAELRWTAEDDQGLTSQCVSRIFFARLDLDDTEFPEDTSIYCPLPDSIEAGEPTIDDRPLDPLCDLFAFFQDDTIPGRCSGEYEINRTWSAMDWCANRTISEVQVISIFDTIAPVITCSDTITIGTESSSCTGIYIVPPIQATDDCSEDSLITYSARLTGGGLVEVGDTLELDTGFFELTLYATDDCGNIDSCSQILEVIDDVGPVLICIPELEVYVDSAGMAPEFCIEDFDHINHYFDNCGIDSILIAKMVDFCDTTQNNEFGFCVNFCCADVGNEVMVIIKVQDFAGNMNFCMINTTVLDTIPPVITDSPSDTTLSCTVDYTDTTNTGGGITVVDNCAEEIAIKITDSVDIDACKEGTVIRTFIACDPSGNADTAVQIITIVNNFTFDTSLIQWAQDTCIENCPIDSLPETIGSETFVQGDSCDVVMVSYSDVDISDPADACLTIERTWTVSNECGDTVMLDSIQIVTIKNYRAPVLSGPPMDTTINASGDSCGAFVMLPRLVATDCSTGLMVTNDCTNTGDSVAMFFPLGTKTITFTAVDGCGNVSTFQSTVNVVDAEGPMLVCPPDTTVECNTPTDTSVTGVPVVMDNCDTIIGMQIMFTDSVVAGTCPQEMTIFRTFTAMDSTGNISSCVQAIMVVDTVAPIIVCPPDLTIDCDQPTTSDNTGLPTVTDNCDPLLDVVMENDSIIPGSCVNEMTIIRTFSISDECGNMASCVQVINVIDTVPPELVCPPDTTVECSEDDDPTVTGMPVVMDNCDPDPQVIFTDSIVPGRGQTIRTIFRRWMVSDTCGNEDECVQQIIVRDTTPPTLECPPDITVGCDTSLVDLSIFGEPDTADNCLGIILARDTIFDLNLCNVGTITRIFIAQDSAGNSTSCEQVITVEMTDSLAEEDIIWPDSMITVDACTGIEPDSVAVGMPVIDSMNAGCFRISMFFEDSIDYNCEAGICSTLVRKWTVIDSCQLDTLGNGMFCFTQNISVVDTMPPMIEGIMSDTVYLHPDSMCDAYFNIVASADDCSGIRSIRNNSMFGVDTFANASGRYPRGLTPVTFIAEDSCCNADTQLIFIVVLDTIPPSISCQDQEKRIIGEAGMGEAEFCVSELIATATDNCDSRLDLRISFDPNDASDTCRVYTCDSLMGNPMLMRNLTLYVTDASGNTITCVAKITVRDPFGVCAGGVIGGRVNSMIGTGIQNTEVHIASEDLMVMTDQNGQFDFGELRRGVPYDITLNKKDDPLNGVSTKDVVMMHRHLLGKEEFINPYQYLAADLNGSNSVEVGDIVRLRKLIVGHISKFERVPDWYFVYDQYQFEEIDRPLNEKDAFHYFIDTLQTHMNLNFIGVKPGDIDASAKMSSLNDNSTREDLQVNGRLNWMSEDEAEIVLSAEETIQGFNMNFEYDAINFSIQDVTLVGPTEQLPEMNWNNATGSFRVLWSDPTYTKAEIRLLIYFNKSAGPLNVFAPSQKGVRSSVVDKDLIEYELCLSEHPNSVKMESIPDGGQLIVEQNRPNPFSDVTIVRYFVPVDDEVLLQVFDAAGRMVYEREYDVVAGWHEIDLKKQMLGQPGVYNYRLVGRTGSGTRRMLIIE